MSSTTTTTTGRSTRSRARGAAAPLLPLGALAAGFGLALGGVVGFGG